MGRVGWIVVAVIGLVALPALLVATSLMSPWTGWRGGMIDPGMMMGGWGILGWIWMLLVPIAAGEATPCPHCGRFVQVGWRACP
jgi:hypothetical protein